MLWAKQNITTSTDWHTLDNTESCVRNNELFAAMCIGFFFLLRISEIEGLRMKDVRIAHQDGKSYLTVYIMGGKLTNTTKEISSDWKK